MLYVDLDYQRKKVSGLGLGLLACGLIAAVAANLAEMAATQALTSAQAQLAEARKPALRRQAAEQATGSKEAQLALHEAEAVVRELRQPWDGLFAAIEDAKTDDVALLSVDPDANRGLLRIGGEARRREAMLDFVQRLEGEGVLHDVLLVEHAIQLQNRDKPVRFSISATWEPTS